MDYIRHIDELLVAPPYLLGHQPPAYNFRSHTFVLEADNVQLNALIDEQLNKALPNGPVRYRVPQSVQRVFVSFFTYDRAESALQADRGWMGYSEAMIGFLVLREPYPTADADSTPPKKWKGKGKKKWKRKKKKTKKGKKGPIPLAVDDDDDDVPGAEIPELLTYLGVVYIDDSLYDQAIKDPHTAPIALGREGYGLPKCPGQIRYAPGSYGPNQPKLEVWDTSAETDRLQLADAIRIRPVPTFSLLWTPTVGPTPGGVPGQIPEPPPPNRTTDHLHLALQFGIGPQMLEIGPSAWMPGVEAALDVNIPGEGTSAVVWDDLLWNTKLVGLKQFPDPRSSYQGASPHGASCYSAIVESPLSELPNHPLPSPGYSWRAQIMDIPALDKDVDLIASFGITQAQNRSVLIPLDRMYSQTGAVAFAEPSRVTVWTPT